MGAAIGVALLGVAHPHAQFWARAAVESRDSVLVCVWDEDAELGSEIARKVGVPFVGDLEDLLACSDVDAVAVQSQTSLHADLTCRAAAAGKHILCEKPMATSVSECDRMIEAIGRAQVVYMQSFPKRFDPVNQEVLRLLREDEIGSVSLVRIRHGHGWGLEPHFARSWLACRQYAGGGALLDEGVHAADLLLCCFGKPELVVGAATTNLVTGFEVEDTGIVVFRYSSGMISEIVTSWVWPAAAVSVEMYGDRGTILITGTDGASRNAADDELRVFRREGSRKGWDVLPVKTSFKSEGYHGQVLREFLKCLKGGLPSPISEQDGRNASLLIDAAYRSIERGCPIRIE